MAAGERPHAAARPSSWWGGVWGLRIWGMWWWCVCGVGWGRWGVVCGGVVVCGWWVVPEPVQVKGGGSGAMPAVCSVRKAWQSVCG